jgi:S1-C subfamily serine protease
MRALLLATVLTCSVAAAAGPSRPAVRVDAPQPARDPSAERRLVDYRAEVARATLLFADKSCAGFVAGARNLVVTAAHCIPYPKRRISIEVRPGKVVVARLDRIDRDTDLALLRLDEPLPVVPLELSLELPAAGDRLLFVGRSDRGSRAQLATVKKLDRCPSLPNVLNALFTSVEARPGDSGAPLVDTSLRVVGLVHGGARCHIAAPVATLARQLTHERRASFASLLRESGPWRALALGGLLRLEGC